MSRVRHPYLFGVPMKLLSALLMSAVALAAPVIAAEKPATPASKPTTRPVAIEAYPLPPTIADVKYGPHKKNVLHFWKAESTKPTPLLFFIHGGGWTGGNRSSGLGPLIQPMLKN